MSVATLLLPVLAAQATATLAPPAVPVETRIGAALEAWTAGGALAGVIVRRPDGTVEYARGADLRLVPASNQKLLTGAYVLGTLPLDERPRMRFWKTPLGVVIDAPGTPSLTFAQLAEAARTLQPDLSRPVFVRAAFRTQTPPGWESDDLPNRYGAPVASFTFDQSAFRLVARKGRPVLEPRNFGVRITFRRSKGNLDVRYSPSARTIRVAGTVPDKDGEVLDTLALPDPEAAAGSLFGREVLPIEQLPAVPPDLELTDLSFGETLAACLKPSDNNLAEQLFLIAAGRLGPLGSDPYSVADDRMTDFLARTVGMPRNALRVQDGSGLSRHNIVTARAISDLLLWADRLPLRDRWRASLATAGEPGTLRNRLSGLVFRGKTGTLDMVTSLSGYVVRKDGQERVVSIVLNHHGESASSARNLADKIVGFLAEGP